MPAQWRRHTASRRPHRLCRLCSFKAPFHRATGSLLRPNVERRAAAHVRCRGRGAMLRRFLPRRLVLAAACLRHSLQQCRQVLRLCLSPRPLERPLLLAIRLAYPGPFPCLVLHRLQAQFLSPCRRLPRSLRAFGPLPRSCLLRSQVQVPLHAFLLRSSRFSNHALLPCQRYLGGAMQCRPVNGRSQWSISQPCHSQCGSLFADCWFSYSVCPWHRCCLSQVSWRQAPHWYQRVLQAGARQQDGCQSSAFGAVAREARADGCCCIACAASSRPWRFGVCPIRSCRSFLPDRRRWRLRFRSPGQPRIRQLGVGVTTDVDAEAFPALAFAPTPFCCTTSVRPVWIALSVRRPALGLLGHVTTWRFLSHLVYPSAPRDCKCPLSLTLACPGANCQPSPSGCIFVGRDPSHGVFDGSYVPRCCADLAFAAPPPYCLSLEELNRSLPYRTCAPFCRGLACLRIWLRPAHLPVAGLLGLGPITDPHSLLAFRCHSFLQRPGAVGRGRQCPDAWGASSCAFGKMLQNDSLLQWPGLHDHGALQGPPHADVSHQGDHRCHSLSLPAPLLFHFPCWTSMSIFRSGHCWHASAGLVTRSRLPSSPTSGLSTALSAFDTEAAAWQALWPFSFVYIHFEALCRTLCLLHLLSCFRLWLRAMPLRKDRPRFNRVVRCNRAVVKGAPLCLVLALCLPFVQGAPAATAGSSSGVSLSFVPASASSSSAQPAGTRHGESAGYASGPDPASVPTRTILHSPASDFCDDDCDHWSFPIQVLQYQRRPLSLPMRLGSFHDVDDLVELAEDRLDSHSFGCQFLAVDPQPAADFAVLLSSPVALHRRPVVAVCVQLHTANKPPRFWMEVMDDECTYEEIACVVGPDWPAEARVYVGNATKALAHRTAVKLQPASLIRILPPGIRLTVAPSLSAKLESPAHHLRKVSVQGFPAEDRIPHLMVCWRSCLLLAPCHFGLASGRT